MRLTYLHEPVVIGVQTAGICLIDFDDGQKIFVCHQYFVLVVQNAGQINSPVNVMTKTELWNVACLLSFSFFLMDAMHVRTRIKFRNCICITPKTPMKCCCKAKGMRLLRASAVYIRNNIKWVYYMLLFHNIYCVALASRCDAYKICETTFSIRNGSFDDDISARISMLCTHRTRI